MIHQSGANLHTEFDDLSGGMESNQSYVETLRDQENLVCEAGTHG